MPSPLNLPEVDMDQVLSRAPYRVANVDLTQGDPGDGSQFFGHQPSGLDALDSQRAALPPDPLDALEGAQDAILSPLNTLTARVIGAPDRLRGALADAETGSNLGRDELMNMRSRQYRGAPWAAFTAAVSQPSWGGAMSAIGRGVGAYGQERSRLAGQDMDIDRLLANYDNTSAQQTFKNRMGVEGFDINSMNAASRLAAIRAAMLQMRMKMAGLKALTEGDAGAGGAGGGAGVGAGGAGGAAGSTPSNLISLPKAMMIQGLSGLPALQYWQMANPAVQFQNTGNALIPMDKWGRQIGKPIPINIAPGEAAQLGQHAAEFKANTGVDLPVPGGSQPSGDESVPAASASAASPSSPNSQPTQDEQQGNSQPASAPTGNNQGTPNAQQVGATPDDQGKVASSVDNYIKSLGVPAAKVSAMRAKLMGSQQQALGNARSAVDTTNAVVKNADKIIDKVESHPNLQAGMVGAALSHIWQTPEYDTAKQLETIKHNMMRDAIDALRASSPTGALNMRITEAELEQMQSRIANLNMGQSPKQFVSALRDIRNHFLDMQNRARQGYQTIYGPAGDSALGVKKFYPTEADAEKAAQAGEIKSGDRVVVGGREGTWQ